MKTKIKFHHYEEVTSTNDVLKELAKNGAPEYTLVTAEKQTKGRGRFERCWESSEGGLWMSLLLRPDIEPKQVPVISLIASLAVAKAIRELVNLDVETKWPNDVLINGKKVCGILPESVLAGDNLNYMILGIGINVNQDEFPEEIGKKATSIKHSMGTSYPKEHIMERFISNFGDLYFQFLEEGAQEIIEEWKDFCMMLGRDIVIKEGNARFKGIMRGVTIDGYLILQLYNGKKVNIFAGEASVIG
jgi:BirA family biotin operon repressor/biotin-[acetyl-CoA-carboxylase] ligase